MAPGAHVGLRVSGIAPESVRRNVGRSLPTAFVLTGDLQRVGVPAPLRGSTVFLQPARASGGAPMVDWLNARFPGAQAEVSALGCR
jgi:hypothetical protein